MRAQIIGTLITVSVVSHYSTAAAKASGPDTPADQAIRFFAALAGETLASALDNIRPAPVDAAAKRRAVEQLPTTGEWRPTSDEKTKLTSVRRVLIYHKREEMFEIKVVDLPQAGIVLHERAIVLITRPVLRLVSTSELQAIVAHEIGHEYFWTEYERSRGHDDDGARRTVELKCDAIAVLTLLELDLDPGLVMSAARKLARFNERFGARQEPGQYPTLAEREQFTRAIIGEYDRSAWSHARRQRRHREPDVFGEEADLKSPTARPSLLRGIAGSSTATIAHNGSRWGRSGWAEIALCARTELSTSAGDASCVRSIALARRGSRAHRMPRPQTFVCAVA